MGSHAGGNERAASCPIHGFVRTADGACADCVEEASRARRQMWAAGAAIAVALLVALGTSLRAPAKASVPDAHPITLGTRVVTERQGATPAPSTSSVGAESDRVLRDWQVELARAEAQRAKEIADEKAAEEAAEKEAREGVLPSAPPASRSPATGGQTAPLAADFFVIPLRVYVLQADGIGPLSASPALVGEMPAIVETLNRIWAVAGVSLELEEVTLADANSSAFEAASTSSGKFSFGRPDKGVVRQAIPAATRALDGFRVYLIHDFDVNGVYFGHGEAIVRETARERPVNGGIHEAIPRVMAHEIGHGLGLGHVRERARLMSGGNAGTKLVDAEIATARARAATFPGARAVGAATPPPAVAAVAGRPIAPW